MHSYLQHNIEVVPGLLHDPALMWVTANKQCYQLAQIQRHVSACKPKHVALFVRVGNLFLPHAPYHRYQF
jgi:hypothetical protein